MKILKVQIKKKRDPGHCRFTYPQCWDKDRIHVLAYEDSTKLGDVKEDCLCVADDEMAAELLVLPEVSRITVEEANVFGRKWRSTKVQITDEEKVTGIVRKLLSQTAVKNYLARRLTAEELRSLDENDSELGIGKGKEFDVLEFLE